MKVSIKNYARALYQIAQNQKKAEIGTTVEQLLELFQARNILSRVNELMQEIEKLDDEAEGRLRATLVSAERLDTTTVQRIEKVLKQRTGAKTVVWTKEINPLLLGGIVVSYQDIVLDLSLQQVVQELATAISA